MLDSVKEYYGQTLRSSADLKTGACTTDGLPDYVKPLLGRVHEEVHSRYYGCGLVIAEPVADLTVLDLGCGSGRDAYVLAQLVGESGQVIGVDMTPEQLAVARRHQDYHREAFGYARGNVRFLEGEIEHLDRLDIAPESVDLIVSNCVVNLSPDKTAVLRQAYRALRPGGEMYFADIYADRRVPAALAEDPVLRGECLAGALYWNDFVNLAKYCGFRDPRLVTDRPVTVDDPQLAARVDGIGFYSATYRLFKLDALEPDCEDHGQAVVYRGTIPHHPNRYVLDKHHVLETGRVFPVCGNSYRMLHDTRLREHFESIGTFERHYGIFPGCGGGLPFDAASAPAAPSGGCC